jgi:putative transposase
MCDQSGSVRAADDAVSSIQDRDGVVPLLQTSRRPFAFIELAFADSGYSGDKVANATRIKIKIVKAKPGQIRLPRSATPMGR